jgi:3-hydroxy acid dehydrogenase/malonic semialdehyde reductase
MTAGASGGVPWGERIALVTGASSGIGAALAEALTGRGCRVICAALDAQMLDRRCAALGDRAHAMVIDLAEPAQIDGALSRLPESCQVIDLLVNFAGHDLGGNGRYETAAPDDIASVLAVNLAGLMRLTRIVLPGMLARGRGDIVNIGSVVSRVRNRHLAAYTASKHGVHGFTEGLRSDYADTDLRIIEILPGAVRTNFARSRWRGDAAKAAAFYDAFPGCLTPEQVADSIVWALERPPGVTIGEILILPTRER